MFLNITQLILLFVLFIWIATKLTSNRIIFYSVLIAFALFLTIESSSVYLINQPFGYLYWINVNFEDIQVYLFQFYAELAFAGIFLVLVFSLLVYLAKKIGTYKNIRWIKYQWAAPIVCLAVLSWPNGIFHNLLDLVRIQFAKVETVEQALAGIGINSVEYVFPDRLKATPGKNIVVISMESLEKSFLNKHYADEDITPTLNKLSAENQFLPMKQSGGGWTAGSLYVTLTGIPAVFKNPDNGNYLFQGIKGFDYSTLGEVLKVAGYESRYLMGDAEFAGTKSLLETNYFKVVTNKNADNLGAFKTANDLDLFAEAKKQVDELASKKQPFALFLSTINSHFPRGIYDPRMEPLLKRKKSDFKNEVDFSVAATDYLVGDFIAYLKKKNLLENTVFYIYPDHVMMGSGDHITRLRSIGRNLYLITNAKNQDLRLSESSKISQLNIPRLIVNGSNIESNVRFPTDFISAYFSNKIAVASLNSSIIAEKNIKNDLQLSIKNQKIIISDPSGVLKDEKINKETRWVNIVFNQDMKLMSIHSGSEDFQPYDGGSDLLQPLQLTAFLKNLSFEKYYFGNYKNIGNLKNIYKNKNEIYFKKDFLEGIKIQNKTAFKDIALNQKIYTADLQLKSSEDFIEVTSSEYETLRTTISSKIKVGNIYYPIVSGINLLYLKGNEFIFKTYNTLGSGEQAISLIEQLNELRAKKISFVMVGNDALNNQWPGFKGGAEAIGANLLASLNGRNAYIGYYNGQFLEEYSDPKTISKRISVSRNEKEWVPPKEAKLMDYIADKNRFIAHAGGRINGKTYTDSLEALDYSYSRGMRLLELDIVKTSDNYYVAAHDWAHWASIAGYKGQVPATREEYLKQKIWGNLSGLDMDRINTWFKNHPDAILVTDKVNEPAEFSKQFVDKNRLMMELFTVDALKEGIQAGILAPMATESLWPEIYQNHKDLILSKKIKYVAASRKINKRFLAQMIDSGIRVYAYEINSTPLISEEWVACHERKFFYGMYIDNQEILNLRECKAP